MFVTKLKVLCAALIAVAVLGACVITRAQDAPARAPDASGRAPGDRKPDVKDKPKPEVKPVVVSEKRWLPTFGFALAVLAVVLANTWIDTDPDNLARAAGAIVLTTLAGPVATAYGQKAPGLGYAYPPAITIGRTSPIQLGGFDFTQEMSYQMPDKFRDDMEFEIMGMKIRTLTVYNAGKAGIDPPEVRTNQGFAPPSATSTALSG